MSTNKFATNMIVKAIALVVIIIIMCFVFQNTIITNDIALGQMNNSDEAYMLMEYYNQVRSTTSIAGGGISAIIVGSILYDIYKYTKNEGEM